MMLGIYHLKSAERRILRSFAEYTVDQVFLLNSTKFLNITVADLHSLESETTSKLTLR